MTKTIKAISHHLNANGIHNYQEEFSKNQPFINIPHHNRKIQIHQDNTTITLEQHHSRIWGYSQTWNPEHGWSNKIINHQWDLSNPELLSELTNELLQAFK